MSTPTPRKRRCLKAVVYMYLPTREHLADAKRMTRYSKSQMGRVQLFDEYGERVSGKMQAFDDYGRLLTIIATQNKKLYKKI